MFSTVNLSARVAAPVRARATGRGHKMATTATARVDRCDKKKVMVSPSILSANFAKLGEQVRDGGGAGVRHAAAGRRGASSRRSGA